MTYRHITIDGKQIEYTIGETFVKFRGGDAVPITQIGFPISGTESHMVTPRSIREYLTTGRIAPERLCEGDRLHGCHAMVSGLSRVSGTTHYSFLCNACFDRFEQSADIAWDDALRVRLDEDQFRQLVGGREVNLTNIKIILADIGFDKMIQILHEESDKM